MRSTCPEAARRGGTRLLIAAVLLSAAAAPVAAMSFAPLAAAPVKTKARPAARADAVLVKKSQRRLYLLHDGRVLRTYRVSLGTSPVGPKQRQGDNRTPEGHYRISGRNAGSRFHRSLAISYPNAVDRLRAARAGQDPGGSIAIHGEPGGRNNRDVRALLGDDDWTEGCIAVSNPAIEELWTLVPVGTPVEIQP